MRVLVTGGAGFVGSALVDRLLAEDHDVDVVDDLSTGSLANLADARSSRSRRFTFHRIDLRFPGITELVAHRKPEIVYHLAAHTDTRVSLARPVADAEVNIIGTLHLLQGVIAANTSKVIFTSAADVYGPPDDVPIREGHPQRPHSPAAVAKKAIADYLYAYREVHGLDYTVLVLADVYGARQSPEVGRVPALAAQLLARQRATLFGEGEQTRDLVFVDDAVDALVRALDKAGGLTMNIGTGVETSERELYDILARITGTEGEPRLAPSPVGEVSRWALDSGRAGIHLGWKPWTTLDDGVARTVAWLREELRTARPTR